MRITPIHNYIVKFRLKLWMQVVMPVLEHTSSKHNAMKKHNTRSNCDSRSRLNC